MKSLFYTSLIFAGALLLFAAFFPRGEFALMPGAPATRGEVKCEEARRGTGSSATPSITRSPAPDDGEPKVETLEELTKDWTVIPPSAFPRRVKLLREVVFKSAVGSSRLPTGSAVLALACDKGVLNLAPDESSPVRGMVRVSDTDLKTQFDESYAKWAAARMEILRKQQAESRGKQPVAAPVAVPGGVDEAGKPVRNADGTYPVLLASMKSGQVTDITPKKIKMWGTPQLATMEGKPTWVIDVNYDTIVFCGPLEARAQAHVRDGKVIRWVFPGSGEQVP